jgi:uncharacterized protein (TIGR02594 family)
MNSRREFVRLAVSLGIGSLLVDSVRTSAANIPGGVGQNPDYQGPLPRNRSVLGTQPPKDAEERIAKDIITRAPKGPSPFEVAQYFLAIGEGQFGTVWEPYASGWPTRWNPVIVEFFAATHTATAGDITAWCAAFANWCFQRKNVIAATQSASSGSFRTFGVATLRPQRGDIVVFQRRDLGSSDPREHVGFFVADHGTSVEVLGGNQIEGHERSHKVSSKLLAKAGSVLTLHSYRTDSRLHP